MSLHVQHDKPFLELLASSRPLQQKALLITATPSQIHSVCECVTNVLHGTVPLDDQVRRSLGSYRETLYTLAEPTLPYADKKKLLVQKGGGFLDQLLPSILPVLSFLL